MKTNGDYVSVGTLSQRYGLSIPTVREIVDGNDVESIRTLGNHRRISDKSFRRFIGLDQCTTESIRLGLLARVSSEKQNKKNGKAEKTSLEHQIDRVETYATEKYGDEAVAKATKYYAVRGGLNHNDKCLQRLIDDILNKRIDVLISQDKIRVLRGGIRIFEQICEHSGIAMEYVLETPDVDAEKDLAESVLQVITHFTAVRSGLTTKKILQVNTDSDTLLLLYKLYLEGMTHKQLETYCAKHSLTGDKGQKLYSSTIQRILQRNEKYLKTLDVDISKNTFETFFEACVSFDGGSKVSMKLMMDEYGKWIKLHGGIKVGRNKIISFLRDRGFYDKPIVSYTDCRSRAFKGVKIDKVKI